MFRAFAESDSASTGEIRGPAFNPQVQRVIPNEHSPAASFFHSPRPPHVNVNWKLHVGPIRLGD